MNRKNLRRILAALLWALAPSAAHAVHLGLGNAVAGQGAKVTDKAANPLPSCGGNFLLFTQAPVTDPNLVNITPLGSQSSHILPPDHMYFNDLTFNNPTQKLFAPSDGWVVQVTQESYSTGLATSYFIGFAPCREVVLNFLGISSISSALQAGMSAAGSQTNCTPFNNGGLEIGTGCITNMQVAVKAGDILGTGAVGDFGPLEDSRVQLQGFANPSRHNLNRGFCPLNYFVPNALPAGQYSTGSNIGSTVIPRTTPPLCGTIVQDVLGTAQGDWYFPGADTSNEFAQMALVHDSVFTSTGVFSVGTSVVNFGGVFQGKDYYTTKAAADGTRIDYDFSLVNDNQVYCYDGFTNAPLFGSTPIVNLNGFIALVQLTDAPKATLQIEVQDPGTNCAAAEQAGTWPFTIAAQIFQR